MKAFHPAVRSWFERAFGAPTEAQARAWPAIRSGRHALVAAPTGSGKTLAAFLAAIDALVRDSIAGTLADRTAVVYVSPLKALANDIARNLEAPLLGIRDELSRQGLPAADIRTAVRTGDTTQSARVDMRKRPPHILVTTPESLYVLLGSESGRKTLSSVRTVIVDEIHAVAPNKRGAHLTLSLQRLDALCPSPVVRIGLSATQTPIEEMARFLLPSHAALDACAIVDVGHARIRDLAVETPPSPLETVMSGEVWQQVYRRLAQLVESHRTTLVFVNTRRLAERVARHLSELLPADRVAAHHGSLAKERRLLAERRLKASELKVLVATASLELGIDIGDVELVCQIGSTRSIATFLQRAGRAGHSVAGTPKARLFPLSREELVECAALLDAVGRGELDRLTIPPEPMDVLAQQIVAEVAARDWHEDGLFDLCRGAYPYRGLTRAAFDDVVAMVGDGFATSRGRRSAYVHRDGVHGMLRSRRGARLAALTSGGTIPDMADYDVVLEPSGQTVGTVNEDFAIESLAGDVFQLGNTAYRIQRVEAGKVRVEDAQGAPPNIPFWIGEAPARSDELSHAVSRLHEDIAPRIDDGSALAWATDTLGLDRPAAEQLVDFLHAAKRALGTLPSERCVVFERFFDESGGMQLVIHAPFGSRINRAWGLALRKRFCRKFNLELQAAATEDAIVISLFTAHSFPLEEAARYLSSTTVREVLVQALLDAPMFAIRWRWAATNALALPRFRAGKRVPPPLQRMAADDLVISVFPEQAACGENVVGDREVPRHPLVDQTLYDCLHEAMDIDGLQRLLRRIESGETAILARDLSEPSPLALGVLTARPYAFLDDAPLEERRTQAVQSRRWLDPKDASDIGRLDPEAIDRVRDEAAPHATTVDELHDALRWTGFLTEAEVARRPGWSELLEQLMRDRRAVAIRPARPAQAPDGATTSTGARPATPNSGARLYAAAERLAELAAVLPDATFEPADIARSPRASRSGSVPTPGTPAANAAPEDSNAASAIAESALVDIVRSRLDASGPIDATALAAPLGLPPEALEPALRSLESQGYALRGTFTPGTALVEWCERGLLARIHRYTVKRLRQEIEPVSGADLMRFLFRWQRVATAERGGGPDALSAILAQLEGYEAPVVAWETEILPARLDDYDIAWLDDLCLSGRAAWRRLALPPGPAARGGPVRSTPIAFIPRAHLPAWACLAPVRADDRPLGSRAARVEEYLTDVGASFFDDIVDGTGLLRSEAEEALGELVAAGLATCDGFAGLRALLAPSANRPSYGASRRRRGSVHGIESAGRWTRLRFPPAPAPAPLGRRVEPDDDLVEHAVRALLRRYGVLFWRLLARESDALPPWRDMLRTLRRLEARGDVRGGRFVAGAAGEQFALPEAVVMLRETRKTEATGELIVLSAADPLNLVGTVLPGARVPAVARNRVLYRDGVPVATLVSGEVAWLEALEGATREQARTALVRRHAGVSRRIYAD